MRCNRQQLIVVTFLTLLALQSCTLAPRPSDTQHQEMAIKRWNGCLLRAGVKAERMCEGYRRDVLVTYPQHLERQIKAKMHAHYQIMAASQPRRQRSGITVILRENTVIADAAGGPEGAKTGDL